MEKHNGYYIIGDTNMVIVQLDADYLEVYTDYAGRMNKNIYIFELNPPAVINIITEIVNHADPTTRVAIYIADQLEDFHKVVENHLHENCTDSLHGEYVVQCATEIAFYDSTPTENAPDTAEALRILRVAYRSTPDGFSLTTSYTEEMMKYSIPKCAYWGNYTCGIDSVPKWLHPELFKDEIIARFRKKERMLSNAFKDDEELWEYVMEAVNMVKDARSKELYADEYVEEDQ